MMFRILWKLNNMYVLFASSLSGLKLEIKIKSYLNQGAILTPYEARK